MAPPDRSDAPRDYTPLEEAKLTTSEAAHTDVESRMLPTAERLASWLEWLLHPEEHNYDRTVFYEDGTKREERGNVYPPYSKGMDRREPYQFESVLAGYEIWQFLHGMTAVATQRVERPDNALIEANAAIQNILWSADTYVLGLGDALEATGWEGDARTAASGYIARLVNAIRELQKIAEVFGGIIMKYAMVISGARTDLKKAAAELVGAFENKFEFQKTDTNIDIRAIVLSTIAAAAVTFMTGGAGELIVAGMLTAAWSSTFTAASNAMLDNLGSVGTVSGALWRDLAQSYFHTQAQIMTDAKTAVDDLNKQVQSLVARFDNNGPIKELLNAQ